MRVNNSETVKSLNSRSPTLIWKKEYQMSEPSGINKDLLNENIILKQRIQELEASVAELKLINDGLRESEEKCRMLSALCSPQDITDSKWAEDERQNLEKELHAEKMDAIGTFARDIANDFNNLLMGIQGVAALSLLDFEPSHPHYENLRRIEEQVQRGVALTDQLLGFAIEDRYEVTPTDMNDLIQKTSSMFGRTRKNITIERKCAKDLWPARVDRGLIEQVFHNLYANARQAMPGGGEICLETENILLNEKQTLAYDVKPGKYVKITVSDTGAGMDEKTKVRIFEPFFTTKRMGRGTGLGLATVYGIIKGHEGIINVYSEPDQGTTFIICLPASDLEIPIEKIKTETGIIATGTETILLVDDEDQIRKVGREMLESMGYHVYVAASGPEAIALYLQKKDKIALVILDLIMPGMSGGETLDRLKEINSNVNVLISSGDRLNGSVREILDRGCKGFLQKPFSFSRFSCKIREMLD